MVMGIYTLKFKGSDKVYVGQSVNINNRLIAHKKAFKKGHLNYKLNEAYTLYGLPILTVICEIDNKDELNTAEAEAFEIFDCIDNGYNIAKEPDIHQEGEKNGASKYPNDKIIEVFKLLLDPFNSYKSISDVTKVSRSTVSHIANMESHSWLSREFPEEYKLLESLKGSTRQSAGNSSKSKGVALPIIVSPDGIEYTVEVMSTFAKEHGLDPSGLAKVMRKAPKYNSHKGWKLKQ
jgi:hypothetical protein